MHGKWNAAIANFLAEGRTATKDGFKGSPPEQGPHKSHFSVKGRSGDVPVLREERY